MQRINLPTANGELFSCLHWPPGEGVGRLPPLLFHHATGFNAQTYRVLIEAVRSALGPIEVWALDARGHGQTSVAADPDKLRSWHPYVDDLHAVLRHLNRPLVLAGHSKGGTICMLQGECCPELIRGIVAIDPVMQNSAGWRARLLRWRMVEHPMVQAARRRRRDFPDIETALNSFRGRGAFSTWPDACIRDYLEGGTSPTQDGITLSCHPDWEAKTYVNGARGNRVWYGIERSQYPIRVMAADGLGGTVIPSLRPRLRERQHVTLTEYPDNGHFLPMEAPELVVGEVVGLYRELAGDQGFGNH